MLLYCEKPRQQALRDAFMVHDVPEMRFECESEGAQVIVNDPFLDGNGGPGLRWNLLWGPPDKANPNYAATQEHVL